MSTNTQLFKPRPAPSFAVAAAHSLWRLQRFRFIQGAVIASSVDQLHGDNNLNKQTALTEKGAVVNGRGDTPNMHDILTGSQPDGRAFPADKDTTCSNWPSSGDGSAIVGHHDRMGLRDDAPSKSRVASLRPGRAACNRRQRLLLLLRRQIVHVP